MRLLVTGGCGFIGSHFIRHALGKAEVEAVINLDALTYAANPDNLNDVHADPRYTFKHMNVRDGGGVRGILKRHKITHIVHMAAESHVDRSIIMPEEFLHTNITGTFNLLNAVCLVKGIKRFVHVSTDEVYGSVETGLTSERAPLNPGSPYSASKAASDMLVLAYHNTYNVPAIITRSSNNYGTHQFAEKFIPTAIRSILEDRSVPIYGDGLYMRDWIHVQDNVRAIWAALKNGKNGAIYNISMNRPVTNLDLVEAIGVILKTKVKLAYVLDRVGHDRRYAPDSSLIREDLMWAPMHTFTSSLPDVVRWYMER